MRRSHERCGVAKLFPETLSERPPSHGTSTFTPRPKNSTGGFGLAKNVERVGLLVAARRR